MSVQISKIPRIAVVIPCFRVEKFVLDVLKNIGSEVDIIICVDDACPNSSGEIIRRECKDQRVVVLFNQSNLGVGGAMIVGYRAALELGATIIVKLDGDGQMDPRLVERFVRPIVEGRADYTKGNRFFRIESLKDMPHVRLVGNAGLSFLTKLSSGYWDIFDPTNGYTAIHRNVLFNLPLDKLNCRYFFESDMLFRLNTLRACVLDIPMEAHYGDERSNMKISNVIAPFFFGHVNNFFKRIFYNYILRDFHVASVELLLGVALLIFGAGFGALKWIQGAQNGLPTTAGTVMLAALPILTGLQMLLGFLSFDIHNTPRTPIHHLFDQ